MTDETREQIKRQIERDADLCFPSSNSYSQRDPDAVDGFIFGANKYYDIAHAAGVKEGRRQAIEECIIEVEQVAREVVDTQRDYSVIKAVKKELEKLKL